MRDSGRSVLRLLGRSSLGVAIGMTLTAVVLASLLPLHAQAQAPEPAPVDAAARTHGDDAKRNAAHERHW